MAGINRASELYTILSESRKRSGIKCVFISYQHDDLASCKKIADFLLGSGIDVYFDEYDRDLKTQNQLKNPMGVVNCLRKGINNSSHMLTVISPKTLSSQWVPWEIGFGYDKTVLGALCLKGIRKGDLPDYLKTARIIRDIWDLNHLVAELVGASQELLLEKRIIFSYNSISNPLVNVMDSLISEKY
jgi:hypothetical protein